MEVRLKHTENCNQKDISTAQHEFDKFQVDILASFFIIVVLNTDNFRYLACPRKYHLQKKLLKMISKAIKLETLLVKSVSANQAFQIQR